MKLLGWMHRKLRHNSNEPLREFFIGRESLDDHHYILKPNSSTRTYGNYQLDPRRKSFPGREPAQENRYTEEESSASILEPFDGFLAIGTLGSNPVVADPSTPAFSNSVENITEKETEVKENELKLINDELEKVLGAEAKEDGCNVSSARNSHVSNGRSSHGSTITIAGKPIEGSDNIANGNTVCPLQGYLFGSAIELSETTVAKREYRTSLGELFQRTNFSDENLADTFDKEEEKRAEKDVNKSAVQLIKKKLKKKMLNVSSRSSTTSAGGTADSASAETKLHKILHMFHRKVHPQTSVATEKHRKHQKKGNKLNLSNEGHILPDEDVMIYPQRVYSRESIRHCRNQFNTPEYILQGSESNGNREYWIKTDADYLVLEL